MTRSPAVWVKAILWPSLLTSKEVDVFGKNHTTPEETWEIQDTLILERSDVNNRNQLVVNKPCEPGHMPQPDRQPELIVKKLVNDSDAQDVERADAVEAGSETKLTFEVTNEGNIPVAGVLVVSAGLLVMVIWIGG